MNYRMVIIYPAQRGARFDWDYYLERHLPLAVGTSHRHAAITYCDCDRPLDAAAPVACICNVSFADREALGKFCEFFAAAHEDAATIVADEPSYTTIKPLFVALECPPAPLAVPARYRVVALIPRDVPAPARSAVMDAIERAQAGGPARAETATAIGTIPLSAPAVYDAVWRLDVATRAHALALQAALTDALGARIPGRDRGALCFASTVVETGLPATRA